MPCSSPLSFIQPLPLAPTPWRTGSCVPTLPCNLTTQPPGSNPPSLPLIPRLPTVLALGLPIPSVLADTLVGSHRSGVDVDLSGKPAAAGAFGEVFFGTLRACGTPVVLKRARAAEGPLAGKLLRHERAVTKALPDLGAQSRWPRFLGDYEHHSKSYVMWERVGDRTLEDYLSGMPKCALARAVNVIAHTGLDFSMFSKIVGELLVTIDTLHGNGFVHRDIKPANIIVSGKQESPLQLIDFGSAVATNNILFSRPVDTIDPLYAAPEKYLHPLAADRFDVFSVALIGLRVLLPSFSSERTLREFRNRLESVEYDFARYRKERCTAADIGASGMTGELAELFNTKNPVAVRTSELLGAMLRKNPVNRISARRALEQSGLF